MKVLQAVVSWTHSQQNPPWRQLPRLLSNLHFKGTFLGIAGIKSSYFPPWTAFIGATNSALLDTDAVSEKAHILREGNNHFTVGIWFCNVEMEKERRVYEHVSPSKRWVFALIMWRGECCLLHLCSFSLGGKPPLSTLGQWEGRLMLITGRF